MRRAHLGLVPLVLLLACCNINIGKEVEQNITYAIGTPDGKETGYAKDADGNVVESGEVSLANADYAFAIEDLRLFRPYSKLQIEMLLLNVGTERLGTIRFLCKMHYTDGEYEYITYTFETGLVSGRLGVVSDSRFTEEMPETIEVLQVTIGTELVELSSPFIIEGVLSEGW